MKKSRCLTALTLAGCMIFAVFSGGCGSKAVETTAVSRNEETKKEQTEAEASGHAQETKQPEETSENRLMPLFPLEVGRKLDGEWDMGERYFYGCVPQLYLLDIDQEHPALRSVFERYNSSMASELESFFSVYHDRAVQLYSENPGNLNGGWYYNRKFWLGRADEKVFSFRNNYDRYTGGNAITRMVVGYHYDTASGRALTLKEVAADYDALYSYVKEKLETNTRLQKKLYEDYADILTDMFEQEKNEENPYDLQWYFTRNGITIRFNADTVADYHEGDADVEIPYERTDLIAEEYAPKGDGSYVLFMDNGETVYVDTDGDGKEESFMYMENRSLDGKSQGTLIFYLGRDKFYSEDFSGEIPYIGEGYDIDGFVIHTSEGKTWLYLQTTGEGESTFLSVCDLSNKTVQYVGGMPGSFGDFPIITPEAFLIFDRIDLLGTYGGYRIFHIGENGMPETDESEYRLLGSGTAEEDYRVRLTSVRELEVTMLDENGNLGEQETLPAGTVFTIAATDGETYVNAQLDDGRICRIFVEKKTEDWGFQINGVNEEDCFEYIPYAG